MATEQDDSDVDGSLDDNLKLEEKIGLKILRELRILQEKQNQFERDINTCKSQIRACASPIQTTAFQPPVNLTSNHASTYTSNTLRDPVANSTPVTIQSGSLPYTSPINPPHFRSLTGATLPQYGSSTNTTPYAVPTIKIKDAVDVVPEYNGKNMSVLQFARACKRARSMVSEEFEPQLTRFLRNKLKDQAYLVVEDEIHGSIDEMIRSLKQAFAPCRSADSYRGELSNVFMRPKESIFTYISRVKDLRSAIYDGEKTEQGFLAAEQERRIDKLALDSYYDGLPLEYRMQLKLEGFSTLQEAFSKSIEISKRIERDRRRSTMQPRYQDNPQTPTNNDAATNPPGPSQNSQPQNSSINNANKTNQTVCNYCKKLGHDVASCWKLRYKNENQLSSTSQATAGSSSSPSNVANIASIDKERIPLIPLFEQNTQSKINVAIDTGSAVNLIKVSAIDQLKINPDEATTLSGITKDSITTLGTVELKIFGKTFKFHVVTDNFPFCDPGLIGRKFLRENKASINFRRECVEFPYEIIGFVKGTDDKGVMKLPPRSIVNGYATVDNNEIKEGYTEKEQLTDGVFIGTSITKNNDGRAYLQIINTNNDEISLPEPTITLHECDVLTNDNDSDHGKDNNSKTQEAITSTEDYLDNIDFCTTYSVIERQEPNPSSLQGDTFTINRRVKAIKDLINTEHLNLEEERSVNAIITTFHDVFYLPEDDLPGTDLITHKIITMDDTPLNTKQYRYLPMHRAEINKQVDELLKKGIVEPSVSPYNSPVWVVPKKPGANGEKKWRMVVDYRTLNDKTVGDAYPLPNINDILDQLGGSKYFCTFDLASGFHQIKMDPPDAPKTAFSTPFGHYQFSRMPFGLKNAPGTFQRLIDRVLVGLQGLEMFVYMDDIVVYAKSMKEMEVKFRKLALRLRAANLKLQPEKCNFFRKEVSYLGHLITEDLEEDTYQNYWYQLRTELEEPQKKGSLSGQYSGPHRVLRVLENENVEISFPGGNRIVHANKLRKTTIPLAAEEVEDYN